MSGFAIGLRPGGSILLIGILATMTPARALDFTELSIDELMQVEDQFGFPET